MASNTITIRGKKYSFTGRFYDDPKTGVRTLEYEAVDGSGSVWVDSRGNVYNDRA